MEPQPRTPSSPLSPAARAALSATYGLFLLTVWIPLCAVLIILGLRGLWAAAAYGLLHSGGIALPRSWFDPCSSGARVIALGALWEGARVMQRERTIGPGGRVLFVRRHLRWRWPRIPARFYAALLALVFLVVYLGEWDGNPWLPDVLSLALLLTTLYTCSLGWPLGVLRVMARLGSGLLRLARRGPRRAETCATLMLLASLAALRQETDPTKTVPTWSWPRGGARALLVDLADELEPALALREDLRRFFAPLMEAVPQALGRAETSSARSRLAGDFIADPGDMQVGDPEAWQQCLTALWPEQVRFQQRALAAQFSRFDSDQIYDVLMGSLVRVCLYASTRPVTYLNALFERAARNRETHGNYAAVVRVFKWWKNQHPSLPKHPKSYPLERLVGECCPEAATDLASSFAGTLQAMAARYGATAARGQVPFLANPGLPQVNVLARVAPQDFAVFMDRVAQAAQEAEAALRETDKAGSVALWRRLLGDLFPGAAAAAAPALGGRFA